MAEMVTYLPISSPFIRFAGRYVDDAFGVAAGYNFFVFEAMLVPFEIVACNVIIHFWSDVVPAGAIIAIVLCCYALVNLFAVKWYGETEFWLALGKVLLIVGLIIYTFIAMLGGNPLHDRFGFRYWNNPGSFTGKWTAFIGMCGFSSYLLPHRTLLRRLARSLPRLLAVPDPSKFHHRRAGLRLHGRGRGGEPAEGPPPSI
jgi:amino acid permease